MNDTADLSDLELLVLARLVGGLRVTEFWENVNLDDKRKTIPTDKLSLYGLCTKLREMASGRGI